MGEAKRRRANATDAVVYHHTSTLRTNLIWMSGVIQVEGKSEGVFHPQLGEITTNALARRSLKDFPAVAWFTRRIEIPQCLLKAEFFMTNKDTGERIDVPVPKEINVANVIALNRIALGFPIADIPIVPWPQHYGYSTNEGRELNASARDAGDDPDDWYVADEPVEVLKASQFWYSKSKADPKLVQFDKQLEDIRRMVALCRSKKGVYIPPSWLTTEQAEAFAKRLNVPVAPLHD